MGISLALHVDPHTDSRSAQSSRGAALPAIKEAVNKRM
jgi:hypothetical protein